MKVLFLAPAESELDDAFNYYQSLLEGLGYRFIEEVTHSIERITRFANAYPLLAKPQDDAWCAISRMV